MRIHLFWNGFSSILNHRLIQQEDGDFVSYGKDAAALPALERLAIGLECQRFLALRADENVEQVLGNHGGFVNLRKLPAC